MTDESIFLLAQEKASPAERSAFLDEACAGDAERRRRIEWLLGAADRPIGILERGPELAAADLPISSSSLAADRLFAGRYKLRQKLGEGGMGEVWVADQIEPVQRRVALKVIRIGHDTDKMLARFEQERQALAVMDHPNIAKVLDAGVDDVGRPFFVMELIKGVAITDYCDAERLSPRQRIELFIPVCHAVQHAHQKGIIHRDLKPSNILVGLYDDRAVPKIIDFGVAKATGPRLSEQSIYTEIGSLIGTLEYMSPEQAEPNNLDVDTRSDIYSLGAVLYELLTGAVPFSRKELQSAAFVEMLRIIKEVEPPKPSTRLSGSGTLPSVAAVRRMEPNKLIALLRGELDWIIVKCLEKGRARRYATANALAMDLQRYLSNEPVGARPPSAGYRFRKFLRRNRALVTAAAIMLILLVGGIVGTSIGLVRADRARRDEADRAAGERRAKLSAEKRLAQIEKGIDILGSIFDNINPDAEEKEGRPLRMILGDRLDHAAAELDGEAVGDALVVARLQDRLARTYLGLGHYDKAVPLFAKAVATRQAEIGDDDPRTLRSMVGLATAYQQSGKVHDAIELLEHVRDVQLRTIGPKQRDTLATQNQLGWILWLIGEPKKAVELLERVRDERKALFGEDDEETIDTYRGLGVAYTSLGKRTEAIESARMILQVRRKNHAPDHPLVINAMNHLGYVLKNCFKMKDALVQFEKANEIAVPKLGPTHPLTLAIQANLADSYRAFNRTDEAIALGEIVYARRTVALGPDHYATLDSAFNLAQSYGRANRLHEALPLFEKAAEDIEKRDFALVAARSRILALCDCLEDLDRYDRAEIWRRKLVKLVKSRDGAESPTYATQLHDLGANLLHQRKFENAETKLRECLDLRQKHQSKSWRVFNTQCLLGEAILGQKQYAAAEPLLLEGYRGLRTAIQNSSPHDFDGPTPERLRQARERIVQLYDAWGKKTEADKWREESPKQPLTIEHGPMPRVREGK
jgi:serine/threonine protein kinase/tetratricopeptide (TPR) repeat protein